MVIATLNRTFRSWLFAKIGAEYILRLLPRGTHQWRKFRTPSELRQVVTPAHFDRIETVGVKFNPFARTFRLTKSLAINYMMVADGRH
jgi:2-polyprenyl-6-hydroxyphenyl methylase/3-demethylubiquinone-9 3-methyltransferase